jgi:hypothetical protein
LSLSFGEADKIRLPTATLPDSGVTDLPINTLRNRQYAQNAAQYLLHQTLLNGVIGCGIQKIPFIHFVLGSSF